MEKRDAKISALASIIALDFYGKDIHVSGLGLCNRKTEYDSILSYLTSMDYLHYAINNSSVHALIVNQDIYDKLSREYSDSFSLILSEHPEDDFYTLHEMLYKSTTFYDHFDFKPVIGQDCQIHQTAIIEPGVTIGDRVKIGAYSVISGGVTIGNDSQIGRLSVIGSQGFQAIKRKDGSTYNPIHVGGTIIGNKVWIGDHVTVCNALFEGSVYVGDNTLIDCHTQVAHNCIIGKNNVITAGVIMLGSSTLKNNCWLAPGSMVMNRITVEDNGFIGINSVANSDVKLGTTVIGTPAIEISEYVKNKYALNKIIKNKKNGY